MTKIKFLNIYVDNLTLTQSVEEVKNIIEADKPSYLVTPNMDHIVLLENDALLREIYKNAALVLTDGKPLIWISKLNKNPIIEKVSGSDLFPKVCEMASKEGFSIFILGAAEGVAQKAAENLKKKYEGLIIAGYYSPKFGFEKDTNEIEYIINLIKKKKPSLLVVALGSPKGEKFIYKYIDELQIPLSMSIGATIDFEAGNIKRAPKWMSDNGLEWAYRLVKEPKRLGRRYWNDAKQIFPIIRKYRVKK